jgi:hypothetical protein
MSREVTQQLEDEDETNKVEDEKTVDQEDEDPEETTEVEREKDEDVLTF